MSKFYKEVETPQEQGVQARGPVGPTKDVNARQSLTNKNNIGSAINDILGITQTVAKAVDKDNERDLKAMETKDGFRADGDVQGIDLFSNDFFRREAEEEGIDVSQMSVEEMQGAIPSIMSKFIESKGGLSKAEYLPIVKSRLESQINKFIGKKSIVNKQSRRAEGYKNANSVVGIAFKKATLEEMPDFTKTLDAALEERVGYDPETGEELEIADTHENAKSELFKGMMNQAIISGDLNAMKKLKSESMKEWMSDIPNSENVMSMIEQQLTAAGNKKRQANLDTVEETSFAAVTNGLITDKKELNKAIDEQVEAMEYKPSTKSIVKLKASLNKKQDIEINYDKYSKSLNSGDATVLNRSTLTAEEKNDVLNKNYATVTGHKDFSADGFSTEIKSGKFDASDKHFAMTGVPWAPDVVSYVNTPATGGVSKVKHKQDALTQLMANTKDTLNPIQSVMTPKNMGKFIHTGQLLDRVEAKTMTDTEFTNTMAVYANDMVKNTNSFNMYTSPFAQAARDEGVDEWLLEASTDIDWTPDENSVPEYTKGQKLNNFNILIDAGLSKEEAMERADTMYEQSHKQFENPDGTEGVLAYDFRRLDVDDIFDVGENLESVRKITRGYGYFDKAFSARSHLSIRPVRGFNSLKQYQFYYDGVPLSGATVNVNQLNDNISKLKQSKRVNIEKADKERRNKLK